MAEKFARGRRVVLLTGAAGGIGRAITAALLADGHAVAAVDRNRDALKRLGAENGNATVEGAFAPVFADLARPDDCLRAVDEAQSIFGHVDAVINNAGIGMSSLRPDAETRLPGMGELTAAVWDDFYAINVRAPMLVARAALPQMRARGWGRIVNNTTSYRTMLRALPYGALKAALESMSAVWATELAGTGVTVNVLVPGGPTDTPFIADEAGWPRDKMLKPVIMGPPARWLLSDASDAVTGKRITAARWDDTLAPDDAFKRSSRDIGWPELSADAVWLQHGA